MGCGIEWEPHKRARELLWWTVKGGGMSCEECESLVCLRLCHGMSSVRSQLCLFYRKHLEAGARVPALPHPFLTFQPCSISLMG